MWTTAAPHRAGSAEDRRETHIKAPPRREETDYSDSEACKTELDLERTVDPADIVRRSLMEDDMKNRVVDIRDVDQEEKKHLNSASAIIGPARVFEARASETAEKTSPTSNKVSVKLRRRNKFIPVPHSVVLKLPHSMSVDHI
jgi:hypothetical protein